MIPIEVIHEVVCRYYRIDLEEIFIRDRKPDYIKMRQNFHYLCRFLNDKGITLQAIGRYYKHITGQEWDHNSVRNSVKKAQNRIDVYPPEAKEIEELIALCRSVDLKDYIKVKKSFPLEQNQIVKLVCNSKDLQELRENLTTYLESA